MNTIPVNTLSMEFTALAVVPKCDQDGVQQRNKEKVLKWECQLLMSTEVARRPEVLAVVLTTNTPPDFQPMTPVLVDNLVARHWENDGKSGIAFSAEAIRPSGKHNRPPAPSQNGTKAPEPAGAAAS